MNAYLLINVALLILGACFLGLPLMTWVANRLDPWLETIRLLETAEREMFEKPPNLRLAVIYLQKSRKALEAAIREKRHPAEVPDIKIRQNLLGGRISGEIKIRILKEELQKESPHQLD